MERPEPKPQQLQNNRTQAGIRRAIPKDAPEIHSAHMRSIQTLCSKDHSPEEIQAWGHRDYNENLRIENILKHPVWVAEQNNSIEGYGQIVLKKNDGNTEGHIVALYLTPEVSGSGLGKRLLERLINEARRRGATVVRLESTITALKFYEKNDFKNHVGMSSLEIGGQKIRCYPMERKLDSFYPLNLNTPHLVLREFTFEDMIAVQKYASDPEVTKHHVWGPNTLHDTKVFVEYAIENQNKNPRQVFEFAITLKDTGELIGGCGIHLSDYEKSIGDIGYTFSKSEWGKGFGTEAAQALITFGFEQLNLHRIWATCRPENIGSFRVLEKCGMTKEGCLKKNMLLRGEWKDSLLYAIVN